VASNTNLSALLPVYNRADVVMTRGEGVYLFDDTGKRYLDCAAGIAVNALGHCHPHLVEALREQAGALWHCSNLYRTTGNESLASRLVQHSFADQVFFTNSGAEAVECGIKIVRRHHAMKGAPRPEIITVQGGFHGRTLACISAGKNTRATEGCAPLLEGFTQVPFHDAKALEAAITPQTGGILLETVQGEGGIRPHSRNYLQAVRSIADKHGLLLFLDEVQCGMGRTGTLFAFEQAGITPDVCSVAKGIGGGFPLGACLATHQASSGMRLGSHGGTYGGNPLAMSVGNAVLDVMLAKGFMEHVQEMGRVMRLMLAEAAIHYPHILGEVRGAGLMLGVQVHGKPQDFVVALRGNGLLAVAASGDDIIRFVPPLIITQAHIEEAATALHATCGKYK
jgi:acetylornithine/N-succinyldiaminopimelate aminotransferase